MKKVLLAVVMFVVGFVIYAQSCPKCGMSMVWTGKTELEFGKLLKVYKCTLGHEYLLTSEQENSNKNRYSYGNDYSNNTDSWNSFGNNNQNTSPKCPVCGAMVVWTGESELGYSGLLKKYKCSLGHVSVSK